MFVRKWVVILGAFLILSGCTTNASTSDLQAALTELQASYDKLQSEHKTLIDNHDKTVNELESIKYGAERLTSEIHTYVKDRNLVQAQTTLALLLERHPGDPGNDELKTVVAKLDEEIQKEEKDKKDKAEAEAIAKKEAEEKRIKDAVANMRKKADEVTGTTYYFDKSSPEFTNKNGFYTYFATKDDYIGLRIVIQYLGDDWLFINKYIFKVDEKSFTINTSFGEVSRDNYTQVWEWYDQPITKEQIKMVQEIIQSNKTILRMQGDTYYKDREITDQEKKALQNVLDAYVAMGGEL